jgi:hypothetical protein
MLHRAIVDASNEPNKFRIEVSASANAGKLEICFRDWGRRVAGLLDEYIAPETPEAADGIAILAAVNIARSMGGSLRLTGHHQPTEFTLTLPDSLLASNQEAQNE